MHLKKVGDVAGNGTTHPPVQTISTNDSMHCFITDQTPTLMFHPRGSFDAWMRGTSCVDDMEGIAAGYLLTSRDRLTVSTSSRFWYSYEHGSRSVVFSISVWGSLGWKCRPWSSGGCILESKGRSVVVCSDIQISAETRLIYKYRLRNPIKPPYLSQHRDFRFRWTELAIHRGQRRIK